MLIDKPIISEDQWCQYSRDGYLRLGKLLQDDQLKELQDRINQIMMGEADLDYDQLMMQLDSSTGDYGELGAQTKGHKGATLNYRKIEQLELDDKFLAYMQRPIFQEICARIYGAHVPVGCFRAMFMNKPANHGTLLPWHQDRWRFLDRDPLVTVWTALDPVTIANGCVQVIPGSHRYGVVNPTHHSGFLDQNQWADNCPEDQIVYCELEPGEVMLLHNWLMHRSDKNHSDVSRRGFSVCYLDARSVSEQGHTFPVIFGEGAIGNPPQPLHA